MKALLLALLVSGCATTGWHREFDFAFQRLEWNHIQGPNAYQRMVNLCGDAPHLMGCAFRIKESGLCVVFSVYSQEQAKLVRTNAGVSLYEDEMRHCGVFDDVNIGGAWGHK